MGQALDGTRSGRRLHGIQPDGRSDFSQFCDHLERTCLKILKSNISFGSGGSFVPDRIAASLTAKRISARSKSPFLLNDERTISRDSVASCEATLNVFEITFTRSGLFVGRLMKSRDRTKVFTIALTSPGFSVGRLLWVATSDCGENIISETRAKILPPDLRTIAGPGGERIVPAIRPFINATSRTASSPKPTSL